MQRTDIFSIAVLLSLSLAVEPLSADPTVVSPNSPDSYHFVTGSDGQPMLDLPVPAQATVDNSFSANTTALTAVNDAEKGFTANDLFINTIIPAALVLNHNAPQNSQITLWVMWLILEQQNEQSKKKIVGNPPSTVQNSKLTPQNIAALFKTADATIAKAKGCDKAYTARQTYAKLAQDTQGADAQLLQLLNTGLEKGTPEGNHQAALAIGILTDHAYTGKSNIPKGQIITAIGHALASDNAEVQGTAAISLADLKVTNETPRIMKMMENPSTENDARIALNIMYAPQGPEAAIRQEAVSSPDSFWKTYMDSWSQADSLGITHPMRFNPTTLTTIIQNREHPPTDPATQKVALFILPDTDHNGFFSHDTDQEVQATLQAGMYPMVFEAGRGSSVISDIKNDIQQGTSNGQYPASLLVLEAHGNPGGMAFNELTNKSLTPANQQQLSAINSDIAPGATMALISCDVGQGQTSNQNNLPNTLKRSLSNVKNIISPDTLAFGGTFSFDAKQNLAVDFAQSSGHTYIANDSGTTPAPCSE